MAGYRPPYTRKEENAIVRYIVENEIYGRLRGRLVWQEFEATGKIERSWQSVKEHFRIKMFSRILRDNTLELTREERENIYYGWLMSGKTVKKRDKMTQKGKSSFTSTNNQADDSMSTSEEEDEAIEIIEI